jgi:hypothetical protein
MSDSLASARYGKFFAVVSALTLPAIASVALFFAIQRLGPYIALVKGQFYPPGPISAETMIENAFSPGGLLMLRFALWPFLVFVALQAGATYAIFTLLPLEGRFTTTRRLIAGAGISGLTTVLVLAVLWPALVGMTSH